jgi:hypothetical protein
MHILCYNNITNTLHRTQGYLNNNSRTALRVFDGKSRLLYSANFCDLLNLQPSPSHLHGSNSLDENEQESGGEKCPSLSLSVSLSLSLLLQLPPKTSQGCSSCKKGKQLCKTILFTKDYNSRAGINS